MGKIVVAFFGQFVKPDRKNSLIRNKDRKFPDRIEFLQIFFAHREIHAVIRHSGLRKAFIFKFENHFAARSLKKRRYRSFVGKFRVIVDKIGSVELLFIHKISRRIEVFFAQIKQNQVSPVIVRRFFHQIQKNTSVDCRNKNHAVAYILPFYRAFYFPVRRPERV